MLSRHWISLSPLCILLTLPLISPAEVQSEEAPGSSAPSAANVAAKSAIKITLTPSREQAVAGSLFGITARVENVSDEPVYFTPASFTMTAPPELDADGPSDWQAFFADIQVPGVDKNNAAYWKLYNKAVVVLTPGSTLSAFWSGRFRRPETSAVRQFLRNLSFVPGRYTLTVVGAYWDTPGGPNDKSAPWHTVSAELQEVVSAPQSVILFGAGLGGVFAFLLVWRFHKTLYSGWGRGNLVGLLSAVCLSIIVTILLARLSDSQFIIRVTVSDLWGAMAVGFIGAASGPAVLRKMVDALRGGTSERQEEATPLPPAVEPEGNPLAGTYQTPNGASDTNRAA